MKKSALSLLVILFPILFIGQSSFGQSKYSKTDALTEPTTPIENMTKSTDSFDKADMYSIDFEDEEDWTFDFTPWTVLDVDGLNTYDFTVDFPNEGEPMAFIVLNPSTTVPPMDSITYPGAQPHSGAQCGVCLASIPALGKGNDDWFISAMVTVGDGANFNFWAKSYEDTYGLERFNVAVSTTTPDPGEFTIISGNTYVEAPTEWTEYNYDLTDYAGQDIYVAIQCVSYDATGFMIDDLVIDPGSITSIWSIGFEDKEDWEFDFTPWTVIDVDGLNTISTVVSFPHEEEPMAFIVANPTTTVPPMDPITWPQAQPHTGEQCGLCLSSIPVLGKGNDDWFISSMVTIVGDNAYFNFWAHSFDDLDGLDRFNIAVSTTTPDPNEFTIISSLPYVEAPVEWTEYNYDLSAYAGQDVYVAIQCVSYDATAFVIDDLLIDPGTTGIDDNQKIENITTNIYPNPARDQITIESNNIIDEVRIYGNVGQLVYSGEFNNDKIMVNTSNFLTGMYLLQVRSGEAIEVSKLILE